MKDKWTGDNGSPIEDIKEAKKLIKENAHNNLGSTFDSWLKEEGIEVNQRTICEDIKHYLRIRMNDVRNAMIEEHERQSKLSPEDAKREWDKSISEWIVQHDKINIFACKNEQISDFAQYFDKQG